VAVAEGGLRGEVRDYGRIANTPAALQRLVGKLGQEGVRLRFCYEAGPCGYRNPTLVVGTRTRIHCGGTIADPLAAGRPGQDGSAGMRPVWRSCIGRRVDGGVGSQCRARGGARPGAGPPPTRCGHCAGHASSSRGFCYLTVDSFLRDEATVSPHKMLQAFGNKETARSTRGCRSFLSP
jgi:hypothetical protein